MRAYAVGLVLVCFVAAWIGVGLRSEPTVAQDPTEDRLSALETRVAELEDRVAVLEGGSPETQPTVSGGASESGTGEVVISGIGSIVTEDFQLEAGRYEVTTTWEAGCCIIIHLFPPSGDMEYLVNELSDTEGGTVSDIYEAPESGTYFIDSQNNDGPWTVTFKKR